jgi:uncharacterized repeat protein (TIGR02543 family)
VIPSSIAGSGGTSISVRPKDGLPAGVYDAKLMVSGAGIATSSVPLSFRVTKKPVTITGVTAGNKVYDGTTAASVSGTVAGVVTGDAVYADATKVIASFSDENAGRNKPVAIAGKFALSGAARGNYALSAQPNVNGITATIFEKTVTVVALDKEVYQNAPLPELSESDVTYTGFVGGDGAENALKIKAVPAFTVNDSADTGSSPINFAAPGGREATLNADAGRNYRLTHVPGNLTVKKTPVILADLAEECDAANVALPKILLAEENYDKEDIARLDALIKDAEKAAEGALTQAEVDALAQGLRDAIGALSHTHTVTKNTATGGVAKNGVSVTVGFKGKFETATGVSIDGTSLTLRAAASGKMTLSKEGKPVGSLTKGSAIVTLDKSFIDTLKNGKHQVEVRFKDDFTEGTGKASFTVNRSVAVKFKANGGKTAGKKTRTVKIAEDTALSKLPTAKRTKYTFKGWYTKKQGGKKITAKTKFTKNTTLYAHWKAKQAYGKILRSVYVRKYPSSHKSASTKIGTLKQGQTFKIKAFINNKGAGNDWYKIAYKGRTAYVFARYVKVLYR